MARVFVGTTKNGCAVYVDTEHSHAATHMKDTPGLLDLVKEALPKIEADGSVIRTEIDFGRIIGTMDLVETTDSDDVFYAMRPNRDRYSRFVHNREAVPTSWLVVRMERVNEKEYSLFTTYIGRLVPPFPFGDSRDSHEMIEFWKGHALAVGNQELVPETETKECPWPNFK